MPVQVIENLDQLEKFVQLETEQHMGLMCSTSLPFLLTVASTRNHLATGGLIVVLENDLQLGNQCLLAGADVVQNIEPDYFPRLLAWRMALIRRTEILLHCTQSIKPSCTDNSIATINNELKKQAASVQTHTIWSLIEGGWRLVGPTGEGISLTSSEKHFLEQFVGEADKRVRREDLVPEQSSYAQKSRAIDSLVSRLRRKAAEQNIELPLRSVHGWGYSFIGLLVSAHTDLS